MQKYKYVLACMLIALAMPGMADEAAECDSVSSCLALAPVTIATVSGVGETEERIAARITSMGRSVLPELVRAMDTDNGYVRVIIDYAVSEMEDLAPGDFPLVLQIMRKEPFYSPGDGGWSYRAMATIGTEEAIRFLASELVAANTSMNQIGFAFKKLGNKGLPYLVELLKCLDKCDINNYQGVFQLFRQMGDKAAPAAGPLLEIAKDKKFPVDTRLMAIHAVGYVGSSVKGVDASLAALAREDASLAPGVHGALVNLRSPLALDYIIKSLQTDSIDDEFSSSPIWELSNLGSAGRPGGPYLVRFLQHEDWDIRLKAAFALGNIDYRDAVPELIQLLSNQSDWHLVYGAIVSLSRLGDPSALPALRTAGSVYWHPAVRRAADCAVRNIENEKNKCDQHDEILNISPFELQQIGEVKIENCRWTAGSELKEPSHAKQYAKKRPLKQFRYKGAECDWPEKVYESEDAETLMETLPCPAYVTWYPHVAARVADGWLTGRDRGEFGGDLMFFPKKGKAYQVLEENIEDIYVLDQGVIAVTGLAHLGLNRGMIYALRQDDVSGKWKAQPFIRLPGAPNSSHRISGNEILVSIFFGGTVVVDASGNIRMACVDTAVNSGALSN